MSVYRNRLLQKLLCRLARYLITGWHPYNNPFLILREWILFSINYMTFPIKLPPPKGESLPVQVDSSRSKASPWRGQRFSQPGQYKYAIRPEACHRSGGDNVVGFQASRFDRLLADKLAQDFDRLRLPPRPILAGRTDARRAAVFALAFLHQLERSLNQFAVQFKQFLAEADPGRDIIVDDDGWLPEDGCRRVSVDTQIARIAHQEERGKLSKHTPESGQTGADADILFGLVMTGWTQGDEVIHAISLFP
jgi:hypothetical protein